MLLQEGGEQGTPSKGGRAEEDRSVTVLRSQVPEVQRVDHMVLQPKKDERISTEVTTISGGGETNMKGADQEQWPIQMTQAL